MSFDLSGEHLALWDDAGNEYRVAAYEDDQLTRAVTQYRTLGLDSLLKLELAHGKWLKLLASAVYAWTPSSPKTRRTVLEMAAAMSAEEREQMLEVTGEYPE